MRSSIGTSLDTVSTTKQFPVGCTFVEEHPTYGDRTWIYIYNAGATTLSVGDLACRLPSSAARGSVEEADASDGNPAAQAVGVAQHAIAAGSYGFILREGMGTILADTGGITANTALVPGNAVDGAIDSAAADTDSSLGWAGVAITAGQTGLAYVSCRG